MRTLSDVKILLTRSRCPTSLGAKYVHFRSSSVAQATFDLEVRDRRSGLIEKIPYLKDLGITAVELLPVFDFDETDVLRVVDGNPLHNFWGYSTIGYFAPQSSYCLEPELGGHLREFRDLVKAMHKAGIEVILDVVFNHTDEGNHHGPLYCFKGIDNRSYYLLMPAAPQYYMDFSGCGNTLNCNHPLAQKLIIDCLRYWVRENHVDGFRFDEGSILSRGEDGAPAIHPPLVWQIELDEDLAGYEADCGSVGRRRPVPDRPLSW